jgi:large repetitive protein
MMRAFLTYLLCLCSSLGFSQALLEENPLILSSSDQENFVMNRMCTMTASLTGVAPAICHGTPTGSAFFQITNATQPIQMFLDGSGTPFIGTGIQNSIPAGAHFAIVVDGLGCMDTVTFAVTEPPAITMTASATDATCYNLPNGTGIASAMGGKGGFTYQWEPCAGGVILVGASVNSLAAGCHTITATDADGCTQTSQVQVNQPPAILYTSTVDSVTCFHGIDGSATIFATGGAGGFTYKWDNTQTTQTATNLDAKFHYVTITDVSGCKTVAEVLVPGPLRVSLDSIARVNPSCFGGSNGAGVAFVSGGTPPYNYFWSVAGGNGPNISGLSSGSYKLTISDSHGCRDSLTFLMNTPPALNAVAQNNVQETCVGKCDGSIKINAAGGSPGYQYSWSSPLVAPNASNPTNLCSGQYTVTVSDTRGCTKPVNFTINSGGNITATLTGTNPTCVGSPNGSIQSQLFGAQAPVTYQWSNGQTSQNLTNVVCNNYLLTATDGRGCKDTASYQLVCPPALVADSIVQDQSTCFGQNSGMITAYISGGAGSLTYKWSDPAGQTTKTASNLSAGTYVVTVTDANGCSLTAFATITTSVAITATATSISSLCAGSNTGSASVVAGGGVPGYTYLWSNGGTTATISQILGGIYTVTITDAIGCTFSPASVTVAQPSTLSLTSALLKEPCFNGTDGQGIAIPAGQTGMVTYIWSTGQTNQIATNLAKGIYEVTATDENNCKASTTLTVTELDSMILNLTLTETTCFGTNDGKVIIDSVSGGAGDGNPSNYAFVWSILTPVNAVSMTGLLAGSYTITVTDNRGCSEQASFEMTHPAPIQPFLRSVDITCFGLKDGQVILDSVGSDQPIVSLAWSNASTSQNQITGLDQGSYTVIATDSRGCTGAATIQVVEPARLSSGFFSKVSPICFGDANGEVKVNPVGGTQPYTYRWSGIAAQTQTISNIPVGLYEVTITDKNGCNITDSILLDQPNLLVFDGITKDASCYGSKNGHILIDIAGGARPYKYVINSDTSFTHPHFFGLAAGDYQVKVTDANGCTVLKPYTVEQPDQIIVDLGENRVVNYGNSTMIEAVIENAVGVATFQWRTTTSTDTITCVSSDCGAIEARPLFDANYYVSIEDENGCRASADVRVEVEKIRGVFVPTAFSPNEDGENDKLQIFAKTLMIDKILTLRVFDRDGSLLYQERDFKPNNPEIGWDGTFKGKPVDPGVYTFYYEASYLDGYTEIQSGHVTLIR